MHLLHKNLILASIASMAMVGFLSSSSASALDGFSFSDIVNQQQAQREQLLSYLTNPFNTSTACESTNPDSTISCNETPFPNLLFNGAPNNTTWGYDGKGLIFVDNNNLIDNNPQLATAKRGDTLNYSMEIKTQRYNDEAATNPVRTYEVYALFSDGLMLDKDSIKITIDGKALEQGTYTFDVAELEGDDGLSTVFDGAKSVFGYQLTWMNQNETFIYDEDAIIAITYSARVTEDAPSEVYSRGAYASLINQDHSIFQSTEHQATALIDGNILIRRVDATGNPLAGAKYTVDGVKANAVDEANSIYVYDENGSVTEFTTDSEGIVIIKNAPMGEYTVREVQAPQGHETKDPTITRPIHEDMEEVKYGDMMLEFESMGRHMDLTGKMVYLADGRMAISYKDFAEGTGAPADKEPRLYLYNESRDSYMRSDGTVNDYITISNDAYILNDQDWDGPENLKFTYDGAMKLPIAFSRYNSGVRDDIFYLEFNGDEATAHTGNTSFDEHRLALSDKTGCYESQPGDQLATLCKDGDLYRMETESPYGLVGIPFVWRESSQHYALDYDHWALALTVLSDTELSVSRYLIIEYSPVFNHYYLNFPSLGGQIILSQNQPSLLATEFLFQDKTANATPEDISNPQTSDAIIKAIIIAGIGLTPIFIFRKQLTKRAD